MNDQCGLKRFVDRGASGYEATCSLPEGHAPTPECPGGGANGVLSEEERTELESLRKEIIERIMPVVMGRHPAVIMDALLAAAATLVKTSSDLDADDFTGRAREVFDACKVVGR